MNKMFKLLHLSLCFVLLLLAAGCGTAELASATVSSTPVSDNAFDTGNAVELLDKIISSENKPETVPVLIWSAKFVRQGCEMSIDWLDYHDRPGNGNEKEVTNKVEQVDSITINGAYLYSKSVSSQYLSQDFIDYIEKQEDGAKFTFYMLDGQVLFISDID